MEIDALTKMPNVLKLTAIVITLDPGDPKAKPHAARYVFDNRRAQLQNFSRFIRKNYAGASHVNFYNRHTQKFIGQVRL